MKFLLDSCISSFAVKALREAGFEVVWVPERGPDPGDEVIIQQSVDEDMVLVTADKDFGELVFVFGKPHSAIIRLVAIPARDQGKILLRLIETHRDAVEHKALITVDRYRVRIRLMDTME
jgi:predicted nuclease of predicted toxin-antitoxin system